MSDDILETMREFAKFAETKSEREAFEAVINEITTLRACLAPVDDEALVEMAANAICVFVYASLDNKTEFHGQARAAIAAIRPHIEAAERERCAKVADKQGWCAGSAVVCGPEIAAAIRSGSGSVK